MWNAKLRTLTLAACLLSGATLLMMPVTGFSTEQAQQRREGRDVKQDTRQGARKEKVDCRQENNKSNAACRQDKRDTKQGGREQARDIKH